MKKSISAALMAVALATALAFSGIPLAFGTGDGQPEPREGEAAAQASIVDQGDFGDGNALHWALDDAGTLTITGTGKMTTALADAPWYSKLNLIQKVVVGEGVTSVGTYAFYTDDLAMSCPVKSVELPSTVTSIGRAAFSGCGELAQITLPEGLASIGMSAFLGCRNLSLTQLPAGLTSIGAQAFGGCSALALTQLPAGLTSIEQATFDTCTSLVGLDIPAGVTSIGKEAFAGCGNLTELVFHSATAPTLGQDAFSDCPKLSIRIPVGATGYDGAGWPADMIEWPLVIQAADDPAGEAKPAEAKVGDAPATAAKPGTAVTLAAYPKTGFRLKSWTAEPVDLQIKDGTFTMPASQVTVKPVFQDVSALTFSVTVKGAYGDTTGAGSYVAGDVVRIDAGTRDGYRFKDWVSSDGVVFADSRRAATTFVMPDHAVSVTARWEEVPPPSSGDDSEEPIDPVPENPEGPMEDPTDKPDKPDEPATPGTSGDNNGGNGTGDGSASGGDGAAPAESALTAGMPQTGDGSTAATALALLALVSAAVAYSAHRKQQPIQAKMDSRKH